MRRSQIPKALMLCVLLQAVCVATGDVIKGAEIGGSMTNGATVVDATATVIPATGPVPISATEKCPAGLTHRCLDDGCRCVRPSKPANRPKLTPKSIMAKDATVVGEVTNGATVVDATAMVIPATGPVPIGATEKCPDGLTHRCLDDGCYCVRPSKPVIRPRPRPRPKAMPKSLMAMDATVVDATATIIPATGPVPIGAMEKCPVGLTHRCLDDGCYCVRPSTPVNRPRPRPRPKAKPKSLMAMNAAVIGSDGSGATGALTNGGVGTAPADIPTTESVSIDTMEKCPEALTRRCFSDECNCGKPPRPVDRSRPRPRPSPKPTSAMATGALINGAMAKGALALGDAAANAVSKVAVVAGATKNGASSMGAVTNDSTVTGPASVDASGKCLKGLRRRCLDNGCYCVMHPPRPIPRENKGQGV